MVEKKMPIKIQFAYHSATVFMNEAQSTRKQVMKNEMTAAGRRPKFIAKGCVRRVPNPKKRYIKPFPVFRSAFGISVSS